MLPLAPLPLAPLPPEPPDFLGASDRITEADAGQLLLRARFDEGRFSPALFAAQGIQRPATLAQARDRRLAEFLAGRLLAARAMATLGLPPDPVAMAPDRRPLFPHGLKGSISHARGFVACLVTRGANPGVDIEAHLTGEALAAVKQSVLTASDRAMLGAMDAVDLTAVFSAKETLFKALYPTVGRFFGFQAAALAAPCSADRVSLRLTEPLGPTLPAGRCFDIRVKVAADHVLTWLVVAEG